MTVGELHELLKGGLESINKKLDGLAAQGGELKERLPSVEKELKDVRSTVYDPETGLQKQVTLLTERQRRCQESQAPGNKAERRGNWLALGALIVSILTMVLLIIQLGAS